jgi:hypothetical protein
LRSTDSGAQRARDFVRIVAIACVVAGCSSAPPETKTLQVGHHRVRVVPPHGWEHLDHGREQLFRNGETQLRLEDLGPSTREGLVTALRDARALWRAGRRGEAFAQVRALHGPPISFLPWQARADFWSPWTDVTYIPSTADSAALGVAFDRLIRGAEALPETPVPNLTEFVLLQSSDADRREISRHDSLEIHGSEWFSIETWDRLTHHYRRRIAFLDNQGFLLYLTTERGLYERTSGAFDSLLASIEVSPAP